MGIECSKYPGIGNTPSEAARNHAQNIANLQHWVHYPHHEDSLMYIKDHGVYRMKYSDSERGICAVGVKIGDDPIVNVTQDSCLRMLDEDSGPRAVNVFEAIGL
jgi:hypothetical protein